MVTLLFTYKFKNLVVCGAVLDNAVVCIFGINVIYVCRVWWGQMGKDFDNITCYIYLSRIYTVYISYLVNFHVCPGNDPRATSWCEMVADHT